MIFVVGFLIGFVVGVLIREIAEWVERQMWTANDEAGYRRMLDDIKNGRR